MLLKVKYFSISSNVYHLIVPEMVDTPEHRSGKVKTSSSLGAFRRKYEAFKVLIYECWTEKQMKVWGHKLKDDRWKAACVFPHWSISVWFLMTWNVFILLLRLFQKNTQNTLGLPRHPKSVDGQLQVKLKISWTYWFPRHLGNPQVTTRVPESDASLEAEIHLAVPVS